MWSVQGKQVVHSSGLSIEVVDGTFSNPMNLSVRGDNGLSAPQLALLIREGLDYASSAPKKEKNSSIPLPDKSTKPKRPILKLKK
ncbi:MAG: hypothetical protein ACPF9K_12640 [Neptuniibacter sp.]|jgi:hypothetical protein